MTINTIVILGCLVVALATVVLSVMLLIGWGNHYYSLFNDWLKKRT